MENKPLGPNLNSESQQEAGQSLLRKRSLAVLATCAVLGNGLVSGEGVVDEAQAKVQKPDTEITTGKNSTEIHETSTKKPDFRVPAFIKNGQKISINQAKSDLKKHGLIFAGVIPIKLQDDQYTTENVAGFYRKIINPKNKKVVFLPIKSGSIIGLNDKKLRAVFIKPQVAKKLTTEIPTNPNAPISSPGVQITPIPPTGEVTVNDPPAVTNQPPAVISPPETTTPPKDPGQPPNPESPPFDVEKAYSTIMKANTVYIEFSGCSGSIVRDSQGKIAAIRSAEHCGKGVVDSDTSYVGSLGVYNGDSLSNKQLVTSVDRMIVPTGPDANDSVYMIPKGVATNNAMKSINQSINNQDVAIGTSVTIAGYPLLQPNNPSSVKLQLINGEVLKNNVMMTRVSKPPINTTVVGIKQASAANAVCSPGASGGSAVLSESLRDTIKTVNSDDPANPAIKTSSLYPLSAFYDMRSIGINADPAITEANLTIIRNWFTNLTGKPWQDFAAVCFFPRDNQLVEATNTQIFTLKTR